MTTDIETWLSENEVTKCPPASAEGADNLRYFSRRGESSAHVIGEEKQAVSRTSEMRKRNARIKRKAIKARKKATRKVTNTAHKKKRKYEDWREPSLAVLMGERIAE